MNLLITGGAGFIGSHVVEFFAKTYPDYFIVVIDSLTYAANVDLFNEWSDGKYNNVITWKGDITNSNDCHNVINIHGIDAIIHLAAESHVDNSIENPNVFAETNVIGTLNLLNAAKNRWEKRGYTKDNVFYHISTDEVYGHLGEKDHPFVETTPYNPRSPYSASKASSDQFVRAYYHTYKLPIVISNCSNNYGERQHKEKLLPKAITNLLLGKKIPVYGNGFNVRDWLYVGDHVTAINSVFRLGKIGETYNIGGDSEIRNIDIVKKLIEIHIGDNPLYDLFIEYVPDRKGHDFRYAIDHEKITEELGWKPSVKLKDGLKITYEYYKNKLDEDIKKTR
jgi:dTDP-glucose 4,6-dehydratase